MSASRYLKIIFLALYMCYTSAQEHALSPPYTCTTTTTMCKPGASVDQGHTTSATSPVQGRPGKRGAPGTKGQKGEKGDPCQCDIADEEAMRRLRQTVRVVEERNREMNEKIENLEDRVKLLTLPSNCGEYQMYGNEVRSDGLAEIYPRKTLGSMEKVLMNCTLYQTDDEGWIIIQKRYDGSVDFYRDWESYARGFGERDGEFWLGLRTIHHITNQRHYKLRIDLKFKGGAVKHAEYSSFHVGDENSKFKLTISGYSGNAEDRMISHHNGQVFTTFDSENDKHSTVNCAVHYRGAWWYNACYHSNLNGKYDSDFDWPHGTHLSSSEMKIRPI